MAYLRAFTAHDEFAVEGQEPLLLVALDGEAVVGFLALRRVPERVLGVPQRRIRFLVTHDTDRPRVIARPEDEKRCAQAFYRYLLQVEPGWDFLELQEQDAASGLEEVPAEALGKRYYVRRFPNNPNATIPLAGLTLRGYFQGLAKSRRKHFDRCARKLLHAGEAALWTSGDDASAEALFELYLDVERRSWKAKVGGHIARHPERVAFFRSLFRPEQAMRLTVQILALDGVPIAGFVGAESGGQYYGLEEAFDDGYRELSPGNLMLLLTVRHAIERGCEGLDLMGNYAYYKADWGATITETEAVQVYRKWRAPHLKALAGEARRRWLRPPVSQHEVAHNLEKVAAAEGAAGAAEAATALPERPAERAQAEAVLAALGRSGARFTRLSGAALKAAMPFDADRAAKSGHPRAPSTRATAPSPPRREARR